MFSVEREKEKQIFKYLFYLHNLHLFEFSPSLSILLSASLAKSREDSFYPLEMGGC